MAVAAPAEDLQWNQFTYGVRAILESWTALQIGLESQQRAANRRRTPEEKDRDAEAGIALGAINKLEVLLNRILDMFATEAVYPDMLETLFDEFLPNEVGVIAEDGSIEEVSELLTVIYAECDDGNFKTVDKLRDIASQSPKESVKKSVKMPQPGQTQDIAPEALPTSTPSPQKTTTEAPVVQPKAKPQQQPKPKVESHDDDEWTVVHHKKGKNSKQ